MDFIALAKGLYLEGLGIGTDEIWFSDVVQGGVNRLAADGTIRTWLPERRWVGSLLLNSDGAVLCSGPGGIGWLHPSTGASGMLLDAIDGKPLPGVNEMVPDGQGGIYFASIDIPSIEQGEQLRPASLYRLAGDGRVTELVDGLQFPNGIGISPDSKRLYRNETHVGTFAHDIKPDGSLGVATMLLEKPDCDGLVVDAEGNIWVVGYLSREILVLRPDGALDRNIALPEGNGATNLRFGGDGRDLYVTAVPIDMVNGIIEGIIPSVPTSVLYRSRSDVPGRPIALTEFRLS